MKLTKIEQRPNEPLILIVDGDSFERTRAQRILTTVGYVTLGVPTGMHAQQILEDRRPGARPIGMVITEQIMAGGLDGLSLLMLIKRRWPQIRRAIATVRPRGELVMQARICADARTLLKPVPAEKLISVVQEELRAYVE